MNIQAIIDNAAALGRADAHSPVYVNNDVKTPVDVVPLACEFETPTTNDVEKRERPLIRVKQLHEKAMLCEISISVFSPYKRDIDASIEYGAGNVSKHLFASQGNPVKTTNALYNKLGTFLRKNTVPWSKGIHIMAGPNYPRLTAELRQQRAACEAALGKLANDWDAIRQADYDRLYAKDPSLANMNDYPSDIRSKYNVKFNFFPVPKASDFSDSFCMSEEDIGSLQTQLDDVERGAATHVIKQLLGPMLDAVEHLTKPAEDVARFSPKLISNMVDVAIRMNNANVSDDPEIQTQIDDLYKMASSLGTEGLKHDNVVRRTAKSQINTLVQQMKGFA